MKKLNEESKELIIALVLFIVGGVLIITQVDRGNSVISILLLLVWDQASKELAKWISSKLRL